MANLYTPMQVQDMLGISATGLRIYTNTYPTHLSTEATGKRRKFTDADLCWLSFVKERTAAGDDHKEILSEMSEAKDAGTVWDLWQQYQDDWQAPTATQQASYDAETTGTALVPIERLVAMQAVLQSEREAFQRAEEERQRLLDREVELNEKLERTNKELGEALGELKAIKAQRRKPPTWWVKLFGGGE